ncbi:MAG: hypothetical protein J5685_11625 [Clostridiales bacterium]|nr:hypothetical protein [Clostridiales bacterium]
MRRWLIRAASCMAAALFVIPVFGVTGCGKKKPQASVSELPEVITDDMPWYDGKITEVPNPLDVHEFEYTTAQALGCINDRIVLCSEGVYMSSPSRYSPNSYELWLSVYDTDGEYLYDVDLYQAVMDYDPDISGMYIQAEVPIGDLIRLTVYNIETYSSPYVCRHSYMYFDPVSGSVVSEEDMNEAGFAQEYANYRTEVSHYTADGYNIGVFAVSPGDGSNDYHLRIVSPEGNEDYYVLSECIPGLSIAFMEGYLYLGDGKFVFNTTSFSFTDTYIYVDAVSGNVARLDSISELSWITDIPEFGSYMYFDGFGNISVTMDGIQMIDIEGQRVTQYLSFDDCDINRFDVLYMKVIKASSDKIIFAGSVFREDLYIENTTGCAELDRYDTQIVILTKSDTNPHAGQTVISAASLENISYPMAEAIRRFNAESTDSFIMMDPRYRYETVSQEVIFEEDMDDESYDLAVKAAMMSQLSIDLMAGEGPDLIIGAMDFPQLDDPAMLLDLRQEAQAADVYDNIIDLSLRDGCLYQVPLAFGLEGIVASRADTGDQIGFDYNTYTEYINGPCNGRDPNRMTRLTFLCTCLSQMSDTFCVNGGYDYNNQDFADAAAFVNGLILPDEIEERQILQYWMPGDEDPFASDFVKICSGKILLSVTDGQIDERCIMGFPSSYPRGLMVDVCQSIAVSAGTSSPDACRRFVRMLVSDEYQELFARYSGISLNRNAQEEACRRFAEDHNMRYEALCEFYTAKELSDYGYPLSDADPDELVEMMNGYIINASGLRHTDAAVEIIVREEIQPYFAGQRTIERTMEIIQNRVNTFVNERG